MDIILLLEFLTQQKQRESYYNRLLFIRIILHAPMQCNELNFRIPIPMIQQILLILMLMLIRIIGKYTKSKVVQINRIRKKYPI